MWLRWVRRRTRVAIFWAVFWVFAAGASARYYFGLRILFVVAIGIIVWAIVLWKTLPRDRFGWIVCSIAWINDVFNVPCQISWAIRKKFDRKYQEERKRRQAQISNLSLTASLVEPFRNFRGLSPHW